MTDPFARLGVTMVRRRWYVIGVWVVVLLLAGGVFAPRAIGVLKGGGFTDPNSESARAAGILERELNAATGNSLAVVFRSADRTIDDPGFRADVTAAATRLAALDGVRDVETFFVKSNPLLVSEDRRTTFAVVSLAGDEQAAQEQVPRVRAALADVQLEHYVTGLPAINFDGEKVSEEDLSRSELFTIPIVLVLLLLVFRTVVAAIMPLVVGACSVMLAIAAMYGVGSFTDTSIFALNVASMIGLGLGIDFSLIVVGRFREELATGRDVTDAAAVTMATAGRSITYSGVTVMLAMLVLTILFNLMVVRSISLAVMFVALTALLAGLTLLPALLGALGRRVEWLPVLPRGRGPATSELGRWYRFSHVIMRRPWLWLAVSVAILVVVALPARELKLVGSSADALPSSEESAQGVRVLIESFGASRLTPIQVVIQTREPDGVFTPAFLSGLQALTDRIAADPRTDEVFSLATLAQASGLPADRFSALTPELIRSVPGGAEFVSSFVNLDGERDTTAVTIFSRFAQYTEEHEGLVRDLRAEIIPSIEQLNSGDAYVTGDAASFLDFQDQMYGRFPLLVAGVMLVTFIVLMMFFQSVFLPLKAILMNLATIIATYGALVTIFQYGWGDSLLGFTAQGRLDVFTPPILFAVLFGLSTDYEVFMLSRVKEFYHETGNNEEAVAAGLEQTARVITAAGLILIGTFASFATARIVVIKEIGIGLAIGVLLDSTVVRIIMVPATMRLAGKANWWMPAWLKRIVPELREGPAPTPVLAPIAADVAPARDTAAAPNPAGRVEAVPAALPAFGHAPQPTRPTVGWLEPVNCSVGCDRVMLPRRYPLRIGREGDNELQLFDQRVSRRHARIDYWRGAFFITDLDSTAGVHVNGRRIGATTVLRRGDMVEIGDMGIIRFVYGLEVAHEPVS